VRPQIRLYAPGDRVQLIRTIDTVCGEGRWMSTGCFEPTPAWTHALRNPRCLCHLLLVVEDREHVIGWCRTFPKDGLHGVREATLGIGLLPAYRDRGIGTALVRRSLGWARNVGYQRISLTTRPDNARAIHVFTCCGFGFTGQAGDNLLEMACDLSYQPSAQGADNCESFTN